MAGGREWEEESEAEPSDASDFEPSAAASSEDEDEEMGQGEEEEEEDGGAAGDGEGAAERPATQAELEERRQQNIRAMVSGTGLALRRQALLPRMLTVQQVAVVLRRPFKSPHPNAPAVSQALKRKLAARNTFVPWGGGKFVPLKLSMPPREPEPLPEGASAAAAAAGAAQPAAVVLPPGVDPLVLWAPPAGAEGEPVRVDDMLTQFLRPHQREGVQFMFECVTGLRSFQGQGCILADDMGLGKTLQGISLLWTLLSSRGHLLLGGDPVAKRVIICCPTSLVGNWDSECQKWLKGRVRTLPLCESSRDEALASISQFLSPRNPYQVMIVSYETFRIHAERFQAEGTCDLLICDEAHRLKNDATLTNRALDSLACRRRVLLSGTPLQNRLDEFYDAGEGEVALCRERTTELSALVNEFILRRTNTLLSEHLPPKARLWGRCVVEIVCCRLTPLQRALYCHFLESKAAAALFATQKAARVLSAITSLRKLLNHPKLIWDALNRRAALSSLLRPWGVGKPGEEQLRLWAHHSTTATVPDQVLRRIGDDHVSFVFSLEVDGREVPPEPPLEPLPQRAQQQGHATHGGRLHRQPVPGAMPAAARAPPAAAAAAALAARQAEQAAAPAAPVPQQQQQQKQQQGPAKENAASNAALASGSRLALPGRKLHQHAAAAAGAGAKRPPGLAAAVQHAVHTVSDSDDDFK
ncbi:hypothetical protein CHLNCDRAFT_136249 [Chlorella variabilis]|uniref:Helicase ATP-binding domain-containing protein n=1 Tax=Chlorella variabilis TaxID=554065 RepID=E1ZJA9_CHLVA|nr:hypothetical protein CHLNCDRAFT_136249 [Chlorella variabilis]EFN53964.1 hypothetical protein CHLNCDRAFT_136249 [Chlorella variabilis]|eukprot:XP_005846066.1 hypothetical protein CHLNCDRAFT_136249 [Chlorella variabilis]